MTAHAMERPTSLTSDFLESLVKRVPGGTGNTWKLTEVYTGDLLVELPQSSPDDIARAFDDARAAQQVWASWSLKKRLKVLKKFHALVMKNQFLITDLIQAESGKNRRMAFEESCDVPMGTSHYIKRAPKLLKDRKHAGPVPFLSHATEVRIPKGVVAIIAPWNFPFATGIADTIPALIAGNGVVVKPDNKTALSPLFGVRLLEQAGMPPGLVQVICGEGPDVGEPMLSNADYVMFTGSTATGRIIGELAGKNLIGACLELGGKNPMLVLEDADVDEAVHAALFGGFANSGQICMHMERLYVHDSIYDEFRDKFVAATEALNLGAAYDFSADLGSLVSVDHRDRVASHVDDARAKGATVLTGGQARPDLGPAFYEPTILEGVTPEMLAGSTETFGPVVGLYRFHSEDEAIAVANDTDYGLNASIWSKDIDRAQSVARRIESGNVNINDILAAAYASKGTPSGGLKQSGVGARHGDQGLLKYTDGQSIAVLKKQVLEPQGDQTYEAYARQTQLSLRLMRKTRLRCDPHRGVGHRQRRAGGDPGRRRAPGLELAAVIVYNPDKVGRDAGDLADVDRSLGVAATDDVDGTASTGIDAVVYAASGDDPARRGPRRHRQGHPGRGGGGDAVALRAVRPDVRSGRAARPGAGRHRRRRRLAVRLRHRSRAGATTSCRCSPAASPRPSTRCAARRSSTTAPTTSPTRCASWSAWGSRWTRSRRWWRRPSRPWCGAGSCDSWPARSASSSTRSPRPSIAGRWTTPSRRPRWARSRPAPRARCASRCRASSTASRRSSSSTSPASIRLCPRLALSAGRWRRRAPGDHRGAPAHRDQRRGHRRGRQPRGRRQRHRRRPARQRDPLAAIGRPGPLRRPRRPAEPGGRQALTNGDDMIIDVPEGKDPIGYVWGEMVPEIGGAAATFSLKVYSDSTLGLREFEAARLRIAQINGCLFCQDWRTERDGEKVEETFDQAVRDWRTTDAFDDRTRLAAEYAELYATRPPQHRRQSSGSGCSPSTTSARSSS